MTAIVAATQNNCSACPMTSAYAALSKSPRIVARTGPIVPANY
jgi:hypothetical protein